MRRLSAFLLGAVFAFAVADACLAVPATKSTPALSSKAAQDANITALRALLKTPEAKLDLAKAKLTIDRMIDPKIDVPGTHKQLDALAAKIKARFPAGASNRVKLDILLSSLYQLGPWNDHRPFRYDLDDPLGRVIGNKLLSTYLASRKGNCVSMPALFVILGQKLGLPVTLATAPNHLLAKYGDEEGSGTWLNVEATAGGFKHDSSYERELHISPKAIANQIYLRPLNKRESVAAMMLTLMEFYNQRQEPLPNFALADLVLEADSTNVAAMAMKANAFYWMLEQRYTSKYPLASQIPADQRQDYLFFSEQNQRWGAAAEALGYTNWTPAQNVNYLNSIQREKSNQRRGK
ncbi:MAG: transglutaminase family protein [Lysobacter sp.]